jgi:hypothetical protein
MIMPGRTDVPRPSRWLDKHEPLQHPNVFGILFLFVVIVAIAGQCDSETKPSDESADETMRYDPAVEPSPSPAPKQRKNVFYKNCDAARAAGAAPIGRGQPGYRRALDRDNDGEACE